MKPRPMFVLAETHLSTAFASVYRPYFWNSQSRLSSGQTCRVLSHREMQWKWKACCCVLVQMSEMLSKTYVADAPGYCAFLASSGGLVGLAFNAEVHDVVTANGAVVNNDIPCPESDRVPLSNVSFTFHMLPAVVWWLPS
jgi:hypothetical protein